MFVKNGNYKHIGFLSKSYNPWAFLVFNRDAIIEVFWEDNNHKTNRRMTTEIRHERSIWMWFQG